jgi:hypothetical protein
VLNLALAFADAHSGRFQSCGTEIAFARAGYARAVTPRSLLIHPPSVPVTTRRQDAGLGSMRTGGAAAVTIRGSVGVGDGMAGDLSADGARSRRRALESAGQADGESRRTARYD